MTFVSPFGPAATRQNEKPGAGAAKNVLIVTDASSIGCESRTRSSSGL